MTSEDLEGPDLVVAGAGGGLIAALRAAQLGLSVLDVEANDRFRRGNNTAMSTAMIPGAGSRWQRDAGIDDSPEQFVADIMAKTHGEADPVLASALAGVSAPLVEWLAGDLAVPLSLVTDFLYPGHSRLRCHTVPGRAGTVLLDVIYERARSSPQIDLYTPARLIEAAVTDGAVSGAVVETESGLEEIPTRALLLATNGFGANPDLVRRYAPEIAEAFYYGSEESKGDALRIGTGLGAGTAFLDAYQGHAALAMPSATLAGWATVMRGGFLVGANGARYGDETQGYSEYAAESLKHANGESWIIIDQRIYDACQSFQDFRDTVRGGGVRSGENASDLAHTAGIDSAGLGRTLRLTGSYARGLSADPFGRSLWEEPLEGPLFAISVRPALFHTQGGLRVDENARVLDVSGKPIGGLYASGGAAMSISGHGAAGYLAGNGLLPALGLAYLAAEHVAARHG